MRYEEIIQALREGGKVRRRSWGQHSALSLDPYESCFTYENGGYVEDDAALFAEDLLADDWEVVE